jgi:hypothetical protein
MNVLNKCSFERSNKRLIEQSNEVIDDPVLQFRQGLFQRLEALQALQAPYLACGSGNRSLSASSVASLHALQYLHMGLLRGGHCFGAGSCNLLPE